MIFLLSRTRSSGPRVRDSLTVLRDRKREPTEIADIALPMNILAFCCRRSTVMAGFSSTFDVNGSFRPVRPPAYRSAGLANGSRTPYAHTRCRIRRDSGAIVHNVHNGQIADGSHAQRSSFLFFSPGAHKIREPSLLRIKPFYRHVCITFPNRTRARSSRFVVPISHAHIHTYTPVLL